MIKFFTQLLPHQEAAVEKLRRLRVGALFMEQGTGKTRTALELINIRLEKDKVDKVLWLCPCSVIENLMMDFEKHCGSRLEEVVKVCGIESLSSSVRLNSECLEYVENNRVFLVVDESILIKTFWAKRSQNIQKLAEHCTYRIILNGTPISKSAADLFGQWYLLDWRILGYKSWYSFSANHLERDEKTHRVVRCLNVGYLTDKLAHYTFEVKKEECLDLPQKQYDIAYFSMTKEQNEAYDYAANTLLMEVNELKPSTIYRFFTGLQDVLSGLRVGLKFRNGDWHIKTEPIFDDPYDNPRIQCLLDYLVQEKTIIYCRFSHEIQSILRVICEKYGEDSCVGFYGDLSQKERQKNLKTFEVNKKCFFLVANKTCAGYGLNLQFCNRIIYYNNDWTLGTRLQSEDRVHRIGQDNTVKILDIACENSLDEKILSCLGNKESLLSEITNNLKDKNAINFKEQLKLIIRKENRKDKEEIRVGDVIGSHLEEVLV